MVEARLKYPILLSILAAVATIILNAAAYFLTDSVGLLSNAVESLVNLVAAVTAFLSLWYAAKPVDESHTYGHEKIEFFSSGLEGVLILVAAGAIAWYAVHRLVVPETLQPLSLGMILAAVAAVFNGVVALILLRAGRQHGSIVLEADGRHLLTDVWTSAAVLAGLGLVKLTKVHLFDPLIALGVSVNIVRTGLDLIRRSFNGLMDHALPVEEQTAVRSAIEKHLRPNMDYHALRTRQAGRRRFVDFHLLVPGSLTVQQAHTLTEEIETAVRGVLPELEVTVHIEPIEDTAAWRDSALLPLEQARRARQRRCSFLMRGPAPCWRAAGVSRLVRHVHQPAYAGRSPDNPTTGGIILERPGIHEPDCRGGADGRLSRIADRSGRRRHHRAAAGAPESGHSLRHRRLTCVGDRHVVGSGGLLRQGGLLQHSHRHGAGDRYHHRSADRGLFDDHSRSARRSPLSSGSFCSFPLTCRCDSDAQRGDRENADPLAVRLRLDGSYPTPDGKQSYHVHRVPLGFGLMYVAGCLSGLLGIGSGALKVLAMDQAMRIPFKVSTTTSNFMIGVTAAASAGVYLHRGYIDPALAMPVMLGVLAGSLLGARVLMLVRTDILRRVFSVVILAMAIEMIYKGCTGEL